MPRNEWENERRGNKNQMLYANSENYWNYDSQKRRNV